MKKFMVVITMVAVVLLMVSSCSNQRQVTSDAEIESKINGEWTTQFEMQDEDGNLCTMLINNKLDAATHKAEMTLSQGDDWGLAKSIVRIRYEWRADKDYFWASAVNSDSIEVLFAVPSKEDDPLIPGWIAEGKENVAKIITLGDDEFVVADFGTELTYIRYSPIVE